MRKYGERNGGFDCLELSPGSPCYECTIGSDGSETRRQMKKKSRKENLKIKGKKKKEMKMTVMKEKERNKDDVDVSRQNEEKRR